MPKPYYPTPDELQGATPINENLWFPLHQSLLLDLANTNEGRDLLCLDSWSKRPYPITKLTKKMVTYHLGGEHYLSDGRIGSKWGNVIRYRWLEVKKAIDRMILLSVLESWHPIYDRRGKLLLPVGGGSTTTAYPDPDTETDTVDGRVRHVASTSFATLHAAAGSGAFDNETSITCRIRAGTSENTWADFNRYIALFDFSGVSAGDTKDSATFEFTAIDGGATLNSFTGSLSMGQSAPASDTALVAGDYNSFTGLTGAITLQAANITISGLTTDSHTYNPMTMNATGLGNISLSAVSDFGVVIATDGTDTEPDPSGTSNNSDSVTITCAETSGTNDDPKIVLLHSVAFTPRAMMF